jgi:hypothetical protein
MAVFDFIEVEETKDDIFSPEWTLWLKQKSLSYAAKNFDIFWSRHIVSTNKAHVACSSFISEMIGLTDHNMMEAFSEVRPKLFLDFCECLTKANKRGMLNNFDLSTLSLPIEYQPQVCLQVYFSLSAYLKHLKVQEESLWKTTF